MTDQFIFRYHIISQALAEIKVIPEGDFSTFSALFEQLLLLINYNHEQCSLYYAP